VNVFVAFCLQDEDPLRHQSIAGAAVPDPEL